MDAPPTPARLATYPEAGQRAHCSSQTISRWVKSGRLTGYRVGPKLIRVDLDEVDRLIRPTRMNEAIEDYVTRVVATAPPLTQEQIDRIAGLLREGGAR